MYCKIIRISFFLSVYLFCTQVISAQDWLTFTTQNSGLPSNEITSIKPTSQNKTWIGTSRGAAVYDWNTWQVYDSTNSSMVYNYILDIEEDAAGDIWIGSTSRLFFWPDTIGGLARFDGTTWQLYNPSSSGIAGTFNSILTAAPDTSVWIHTWPWTLSGYGITQNFNGISWYTFPPPWSDFEARELIVDQNNVLWLGGTSEGIGKFDGNQLTFFGPLNRLLTDITMDPSGNKWMPVNCCPNKEILKYDGTTFTSYPLPITPGPSEGLYSIAADQLGNIWVGGLSAGLLKFNGQTWQIIDTTNSLLPDNFVDHLEVDQFNNVWMQSGGTLTIYNENGIITPVELSSFYAGVNGNRVTLKWTTASETNNYGFYVERKKDIQWESIGFVPGNGTTAEVQNYVFEDTPDKDGLILYRLKQVDLDGSASYSKTVEVEISVPEKFCLYQNYPNPFNPLTTIKYAIPSGSFEKVTIKIFDVLGNETAQLVNETKPPGEYEVKWDASAFASGIYFCRLQAGGFADSKKLILMK